MGGTDKTILIAYGVAVALAGLLSLALVASTRRRHAVDTHTLAEFEKRWLGIVVVLLVALLAATIWFTPYGSRRRRTRRSSHVNGASSSPGS